MILCLHAKFIAAQVRTNAKNSHRDRLGQIWTFVYEVRDAEHLEELRKTHSMHRIKRTKSFECREVGNLYRKIKDKPQKERIEALKHRCNYRLLFVPWQKFTKSIAANETKFGALYHRGEHNHSGTKSIKYSFTYLPFFLIFIHTIRAIVFKFFHKIIGAKPA